MVASRATYISRCRSIYLTPETLPCLLIQKAHQHRWTPKISRDDQLLLSIYFRCNNTRPPHKLNRKKEKIPPSRFCSRSPSTQRTVPYQYRSRSSRRLDNTTRPWSCFTSIQLTKFNSLKISPLPFCSLCCNWYYIFIFDIFIFALSINNYSR